MVFITFFFLLGEKWERVTCIYTHTPTPCIPITREYELSKRIKIDKRGKDSDTRTHIIPWISIVRQIRNIFLTSAKYEKEWKSRGNEKNKNTKCRSKRKQNKTTKRETRNENNKKKKAIGKLTKIFN